MWHLGDAIDATAQQAVGDLGTTQSAAGQVGNARSMDGTEDYVTIPASASLTLRGSLTISVWVNFTTVKSGGFSNSITGCISDSTSEVQADNTPYAVWFDNSTDDRPVLHWEHGAGSNDNVASTDPVTVVPGIWYHFAIARNADNNLVTFWLDGVMLGASVSYASDADGTSLCGLLVGSALFSSSQDLHGVVDEVRLSDTVRSAAWISLEHASARDTLVSYAPVETQQ